MTKPDINITLDGLRTGIMLLETELSVLENRRADLHKTLNTFRVRYNSELGMLLGEILRLRLEQFRRLRDTNPDAGEKYRDAETDFRKHKEAMHEVRDEVVQSLSRSRDRELQQKFHKASKLCHPDLVEETHKVRATEIFMDLNNAYYYNNLDRVSAILEMLEQSKNGLTGKSEGLSTRELLEMHETRLRIDIARLKEDIAGIRASAPYRLISEIEDWDIYFSDLRRKMEHERDELEESLIKSEGEEDL